MKFNYNVTISEILKDGSSKCVVVMLNEVASAWLTDANTLNGRPDHNFYNFLQKVLNYKLEASGKLVKIRASVDALSTDKLNSYLAKDVDLCSNFTKNAISGQHLEALLGGEEEKARKIYPYLILLLNLAFQLFCSYYPCYQCPQVFFGQRALQEARRVDLKFRNSKNRWICFVSVYHEEIYLEPYAIGVMQQQELMEEEEDSNLPQDEEFKDARRTTTSREASPKVKVEEQIVQQTKRLDTQNQPNCSFLNQGASISFISPTKTAGANFSTGSNYRGLGTKREDEENNFYFDFQASMSTRSQKYGDFDCITKDNKTGSQSFELLREEIFTNEFGDDNSYGASDFMMPEQTRISNNSFSVSMETADFLDFSEANIRMNLNDRLA